MDKAITDTKGHTVRNGRTDRNGHAGYKLPAHFKKLVKVAERTILSRYDSLGTFDRPQPTIPTHRPQRSNKKNRRKPATEAELREVQDSWKTISVLLRSARHLHALGITLSYSVNTETGEVTVDELGPLNQRARNLLYRYRMQAMWLKKATKGSAKKRRVAREHLYDDL